MYVVCITGASGAILGIRLIEELLARGLETASVTSATGWKTVEYEVIRGKYKASCIKDILKGRGSVNADKLEEYDNETFFAPPASGSAKITALVVAPCSMKTLSAIAHGYSDSLITRGADVALKERRRLVLVPRETPLSLIHIKNMLAVKEAGADIVMPVPGFYNFPETISDVVDFTTGRVLSLLGMDHSFFPEWAK